MEKANTMLVTDEFNRGSNQVYPGKCTITIGGAIRGIAFNHIRIAQFDYFKEILEKINTTYKEVK
ncbi:hypothetical protein ACIQYS_15195 [Psychrobacillus sp. NPDC096426]|uniref:hypothetical protein n=1 Tax=Psychrobacillus sp. NPDC096426 TaxID=3364491 RepID=UPI00381BF3CF